MREAQTRLSTAVAIAREQGARLLELRAATSLYRLLRQRDRHAEAESILTAALAEAGEETDAPELAEARRLMS